MNQVLTDAQLLCTPIGFAEEVLGMRLYWWQDRALTWFENCIGKRVQASLCTPNGAGKDSVVIAALALWWVSIHERGRVIITTRDGKQIDEQTQPAIHRHRDKFQGWDFNEWLVRTPTGGRIRMYATNDPGRVEGAHRDTLDDGSPDPDGPLLIIANEAKSLPDDILDAFDRCTFDGLLYASSPGHKSGRFYESQVREDLGFQKLAVTLKDCPHKTQEQIDSIVRKHGIDSPFVRSTLFGEFMDADSELRFDREGLEALAEMSEVWHAEVDRGILHEQDWATDGVTSINWSKTPDGWVWLSEKPIPGCSYIGFGDPMTGEQSEGSKQRDTHAAGVLRAHYMDSAGVEHDMEVVAALYVTSTEETSGAACRWDNDVLADRFATLLKYFGNPIAIVEANNAGTEVIRLLLIAGCRMWRREKPNHRVPGRKMLDVVGFQTTAATKNYWIGALGTAIRERTLVCKFAPAVKQFATFMLNEKGTGEAQDGCHDDFVTGVGMAIYKVDAATMLPRAAVVSLPPPQFGGWQQQGAPSLVKNAACT